MMAKRANGRQRGRHSAGGSLTEQAEAFRILCANLLVAVAELEQPVVLVTSARAGEGKTSVAANLALSAAAAGRRVALIDLDLRHPSLHRWLGVPNDVGVTDVLLHRRSLESCIYEFPVPSAPSSHRAGITLLPSGPAVEEPSELLASAATTSLFEGLGRTTPGRADAPQTPSPHARWPARFDLVLVDAPPVLPVADALIIGRLVSGALLVVEAGGPSVPAVERAKEALTRNQTRLLGVVLNAPSPRPAGSSFSYGIGYGYGLEGASQPRS